MHTPDLPAVTITSRVKDALSKLSAGDEVSTRLMAELLNVDLTDNFGAVSAALNSAARAGWLLAVRREGLLIIYKVDDMSREWRTRETPATPYVRNRSSGYEATQQDLLQGDKSVTEQPASAPISAPTNDPVDGMAQLVVLLASISADANRARLLANDQYREMKKLADYTDDELIAELYRRRNERKPA